MVIGSKYEISGAVDLKPGTVEAQHLVLKRPVQIHFLDRDPQASRALINLLGRLPEPQQRAIIDAGEHEGVPYIVTWPLEKGRTLLDWLGGQADPSPAPAAKPSTPGEFTQRFMIPAGIKPPEAPPLPPAREDAPPAPLPPPVQEKPAESLSPGEFTQFFSPQVAAPPKAAPMELGKRPDNLSFTQLFKTQVSKPPQTPPLAPPAPLPEAPFGRPVSGTSDFGRVVSSSRPAAEPPAAPFAMPPPPVLPKPALPIAMPPPPVLPKPAPPPLPQVPKIPQARLPVPQAAPQVPASGFPLGLLIGVLAVLVVLAALLVLWVVLRKN